VNLAAEIFDRAVNLSRESAIAWMRNLQGNVHELKREHGQRAEAALHWNMEVPLRVSCGCGCRKLRETDVSAGHRATSASIGHVARDTGRSRDHATSMG
jgi:hypothetical protein